MSWLTVTASGCFVMSLERALIWTEYVSYLSQHEDRYFIDQEKAAKGFNTRIRETIIHAFKFFIEKHIEAV
jgi:hypothetical protein